MQDQDILDRNPGLATLITDINTRFLTPTGTSLHLDQDLHHARYALKHKKSYLETKTLFEPIDRLRFLPLDNYNNLTVDTTAAAADLQRDVSTHLDRLLSILETRRLVIPSSSFFTRPVVEGSRGSNHSTNDNLSGPESTSIVSLLASRNQTHRRDDANADMPVDQDEFVVEQLRPHLDALEGLSPSLTRAIQHSVHQREKDILSLSNTLTTSTTTSSLEDLIAQTKKQSLFLDRCREDSLLHTITLQTKVQELFTTLNQTVITLWDIIVEFKTRYQVEQDQTLKGYFEQLVESLTLKLE
ncbi:hypothetical protein BGZ96_008743 [Linnemannia gamsii]|uniref:Uncharacterized protein n=1 Tax=Linnemannia gamsii TaxID=64522 RepID=A0ABQ7KES2_9FUNG|nr:hypothetical protein BGZ96_008743 [Linnemannia gamsii]